MNDPRVLMIISNALFDHGTKFTRRMNQLHQLILKNNLCREIDNMKVKEMVWMGQHQICMNFV